MAVRVFIVDDHQIMRQGLGSCLATADGIELIGEAADGLTAIKLVREAKPDIVVMDVSMPDLNGVEATRRILSDNPKLKILALSMHADRRSIRRMLEAGAAGYVLKDCAVEEIEDAIRTVTGGSTYLSPSVTDVLVDDYRDQIASGGDPKSKLTDREKEVLQLLAEGNTTKQIALRLHVSVKTIETHRQNIMEKLNLSGLPALTKYAIREGYTTLED